MSFAAFALIVLAAFIHASWNLLAKRAAQAGPVFVFFSTGVACILYLPWLVWILLQGSIQWTSAGVLFIVASGALHLAYSLCLQRGYQVADLSVVYPIARGTGPMLSTMGAFLFLAESPSVSGIAGLLTIVAGILLISTQGRISRLLEPSAMTGVRWGTTTGTAIAAYTVVDAYAVKMLGVHAVVLDWCANVVRMFMLLPWFVTHRKEAMPRMRGHWWLAIGVGALSPLSYILVLFALQTGAPLSLAAPAREMSMMVGAFLGALILKETVGVWRLLGCLIMIIGVALLAR